MSIMKSSDPTPEDGTARVQVRELLEAAIEHLPETYRAVVVLREVEEMSVAETASSLGVTEAVVKTRLHRAHAMLRKDLYLRTKGKATEVYQFHAVRCDRVVKAVFARILSSQQRNSGPIN